MSRIDITSAGGASLPDGMLQTANPLDATLQVVTDNVGTNSTLLLSTAETQINSTLRIQTDSAELLDIENSSGNRFNINRSTQNINLDFASKPTDITTQVGAIRTAIDGTNLADVVKFQENGQVTFTERVKLESDSTVTTQTSSVIQSTTTNSSLVIAPNGTGALVADIPDGAITGGNSRGTNAVDLQLNRNAANEVASGNYSFIGGGIGNKSTNIYSSITGGEGNTTSGAWCFIGNGFLNTASTNYSTISGGQTNTASTASHATVVGGLSNTASGQYSFIGGGNNNIANVIRGSVLGGSSNTASSSIGPSVVGGVSNTSSGYTSIAGGNTNISSGNSSVALGTGNTASNSGSVALGGSNGATGTNSTAFGFNNLAQGNYSLAFGNENAAILDYSISQGFRTQTRSGIGQWTLSSFGFGNYGESQQSNFTAGKSADLTTGATTVLSLDGTGVTNLLIPFGNNRAWNVQVNWVAIVTAITGTATGISVGDVITSIDLLAFKKIGGVSSASAHTSTATKLMVTTPAAYAACAINYTAGASQEMALTFTAPTFVGGGSVTMRVVARIELTEVAF